MAASWFIKRNDKSIGPLSAQQLRELAVAGKLLGDDLVRKDDDGQFTPASGIKSLFGDDTNHSRLVPPPPRLPSPVMSGWHEWISQIQNRWIASRMLKVGIAVTAIVVLIALLLPAVRYARDAARKAQAERQIEKSRDGSATPPTSGNTLSNPIADSSASTLPTETGTFMEQLAKLQGVPANTPLPRREFDKHGGYFHSPRHYYRVFNQVSYDKWVDAFGEPFGVRKAPYGEHEWQQTFQGRVVYLSGWLKTPIHDKRIMNDKPMVILNAVSVD